MVELSTVYFTRDLKNDKCTRDGLFLPNAQKIVAGHKIIQIPSNECLKFKLSPEKGCMLLVQHQDLQ
jgi:hypothetical protein